jgi:hypothetical protein
MQQSARWTAGILSLVMVASVFVPIALAQSMQSSGMHCVRPSVRRKNVAPDETPCHGSMAGGAMTEDVMAEQAPPSASSNESGEPSLQSAAECCGNHDCCCRLGISERDRVLPASLSTVALLFDRRSTSFNSLLDLRVIFERDSARAPPV